MASKTLGSIDFAQLQQDLSAQFSGLDPEIQRHGPQYPDTHFF